MAPDGPGYARLSAGDFRDDFGMAFGKTAVAPPNATGAPQVNLKGLVRRQMRNGCAGVAGRLSRDLRRALVLRHDEVSSSCIAGGDVLPR